MAERGVPARQQRRRHTCSARRACRAASAGASPGHSSALACWTRHRLRPARRMPAAGASARNCPQDTATRRAGARVPRRPVRYHASAAASRTHGMQGAAHEARTRSVGGHAPTNGPTSQSTSNTDSTVDADAREPPERHPRSCVTCWNAFKNAPHVQSLTEVDRTGRSTLQTLSPDVVCRVAPLCEWPRDVGWRGVASLHVLVGWPQRCGHVPRCGRR